jgi:nicotinate-nucleotide adenylyltransferase
MKIGLFFGSFNPIHTGHLILAEYFATQTTLDQVWLMVSPQNPFKETKSLLNQHQRLHLAQTAVGNNLRIKVSDFEFKLPKPSYTIDTLTHLHQKYPTHEFSLIMGQDNLTSLHKWKDANALTNAYKILVYPRPNTTHAQPTHQNITLFAAPQIDISSTYIRQCIKNNQSVRYLVPDTIVDEVANLLFYKELRLL